jgi:hypothetical protein
MLILWFLAGIAPGMQEAAAQSPTRDTAKLVREGDKYVVTIPGVNWTMQFPVGELDIERIDEHFGRWGYFALAEKSALRLQRAFERKSGIEAASKDAGARAKEFIRVSFWIDEGAKCNNDAQICRDKDLAEVKEKFPIQNPLISKMGQWYVLEFILPQPESKSKALNFHAHCIKDGVWVELRLVRVYYGEQDRQFLKNFFNSVRFVPTGK